MNRKISFLSLLLFIIPVITIFICFQIISYYYPNFNTFPFIDGKASVSQIGRGEKTIIIFKSGFFLYILFSIIFYYKISNFFLLIGKRNKLKIYSLIANFFLSIYILSLGVDGSFNAAARRIAIILYIVSIYSSHIYFTKILKILKSEKKLEFNKNYLFIFYTIIILMSILMIIGTPWVNPLFKYPNVLKNIIEWNFFLLTIIFYIPTSILFYFYFAKKN